MEMKKFDRLDPKSFLNNTHKSNINNTLYTSDSVFNARIND